MNRNGEKITTMNLEKCGVCQEIRNLYLRGNILIANGRKNKCFGRTEELVLNEYTIWKYLLWCEVWNFQDAHCEIIQTNTYIRNFQYSQSELKYIYMVANVRTSEPMKFVQLYMGAMKAYVLRILLSMQNALLSNQIPVLICTQKIKTKYVHAHLMP